MSDGNVTLTVNTRFNKLENAYARVQNRVIRLEQANARLADRMGRANRRGTTGAQSMVRALSQVATGYLSIHGAIALVTEAMERQSQLARKASFADITVAEADAELAAATIGFTPSQRTRLKAATRGEQLPEGFTEASFTSTVSQIISGTTGKKETRVRQALEMARAVAPLFIHQQEEAGQFGAAAVAVQKSLGGEASSQQVLSFLAAMRSESPAQTLEAIAKMAPSLAAADVSTAGRGSRIENLATGGAVLVAMASRLADKDISLSGTAAANFFTDLRTAAPEQDTILGRLQAVQADPEKRAKFIKKLKGRAITKQIGEEMAMGGLSFEDMLVARQELLSSLTDDTAFRETAEFMRTGTPALQRSLAVKTTAAQTDLRLRQQMGLRGVVEQMLFGEDGVVSTQPGFLGGLDTRQAKLQFAAKLHGVNRPAFEALPSRDELTLDAARAVLQRQIAQESTEAGKRPFVETLQRIERLFVLEKSNKAQTQEAERRGQVRGAAAAHVNAHTE